VDRLFAWFATLPAPALYAALAAAAAIENFFPPLPADTVVAFGSFLAARGNGSAIGSFLATWSGNIAGAVGMYLLGRRLGAERLTKRFAKAGAEERIREWHERYGIWALFVSRFVPALRALVPPMAGAMRIPLPIALLAMGTASGVWYATITYLAFRAGSSWEEIVAQFDAWKKTAGIVATTIVAAAVLFWLIRRKRAPRDVA
jgi:membrane protein DedA with SNARE-associated domain